MAKQLVSAMTGAFEPERYHDAYREALLKVIEAKVDGQEIEAPEPVVETRGLTDLMAVLEASVAQARASRAGQGEEEPAAKAKTAKASKAKAAASDAAEEPIPVSRARRSTKASPSKAGTAEAAPQRRRKSA
jgi:DNA end-binding protein Ku